MTSTDVATLPPTVPTNRKTGKPLIVTGRLSQVLDYMVQEGMRYADACLKAGLPTRTARTALDKPHVIHELRRRKQVFRASISAANIHHLAKLRDSSGNAMAQLGAIKVLEQIDDDPATAAARSRAPGVVINIIGSTALMAHERQTGAKPLIDHEAGHHPAPDGEE